MMTGSEVQGSDRSWEHLGSHKRSAFQDPSQWGSCTALAGSWIEGGYLRLECSMLTHFGFMVHGITTGKSSEGVLSRLQKGIPESESRVVLVLLLIGCVMLGKSFTLSVSLFPAAKEIR